MVSLLSWYTIQLNSQSIVDNSPIENTEVVNTNTSKPIKVVTVPKSEKIDSWTQEDLNIDIENNSDSLNEEMDDQYEEIIFQDNFDKEYRSWTEDNYLED